ncbi:MAG TPA: head maturation protease, ClpP-related [Negativicutes bacterium]|nr:head maturation protease, ClpP-related [Negativicutes bacterium]
MRDKKTVRLWEIKQATQLDTLEIYVYGYIEPDYYDWWSGEQVESDTSANHFKNELEKYADVKFINLYVNSNGGDVMEAMAIRNQLVRHPAYITGYVDGFACSAASFILTACDKVIMYSNTMQMLHLMWQCCCGNYKELRKASDNLEQISIGNRQAYLEKSNGKLTEEQIVEILENETWLTAEQCLAYGLADEIVKEEKDLNQAKQMLQQMNQSIEQQISYNKALVALKQQTEGKPATVTEVPPESIPEPEPQKENKPAKLMAALFR